MCTQSDLSHNWWDTVIKLITAICVSSSLLIASCQYKDKVEKEFISPIWKQQISLYSKVSNIASEAAIAKNNSDRDKLLAELRKIYIGEARVVGDFQVMLPLARFINELERCTVADDCEKEGKLPSLAASISKCARSSIGENWDRRFKELAEVSPIQVTSDNMCK
ncbi:hypothetical protein NOL51_26470 [Vibrio parahaemolyticus]|uniref:hypothetical protein n=1 Tax=Vibrio parahaemolyticus TaxID=670 RepID=UPI002269E20B|nr:hypothetical protein [Vibrio parahaemolyticus]MCX8936590.1 hypothetical protein [Vibrio parahaemolyticus]MCX8936593.1 hypothetical protein [Vibrio parahaemolyticus]